MYFLLFVFIIILLFYKYNNIESFQNKQIVVIVPCIPKHLKHLKGLFNSINKQTKKPDKVIISLSETNSPNCKKYENEYRNFLDNDIELKFNCINSKKNSAENRNRAITNYKNIEFISYMDADDEMCPDKIKTITDLMIKHNADVGLHSFDDGKYNKCKKNNKILLPEQIREIEKNDRAHLNIRDISIHHGHITIRPKVLKKIKQDNNFGYGEDSKFVREIIQNGFDVIYTADSLTNYYYQRSATFGK